MSAPHDRSTGLDAGAEADSIMAARAAHDTLAPISNRHTLTMADAYAIQAALTARRQRRGAGRIGWKLGYTSAAMRHQMGVAEPNHGPLFDDMAVPDGGDIAGRFTQPRVEPEVALRFAASVSPGADRADVLAAVASAHASLEIVDSVWTDYRFTIEDNTADGSSAAGVVLGPPIPLAAIADVEVRLFVGDELVAEGVGRDASGHPADGVVWLADQLARSGSRVAAGEIVITGGLTAAAALLPGSSVRAEFVVPGGEPVGVSVRHGRTG